MRLIYFDGSGNFGDELNCVLWPRLVPDMFDEGDCDGFLGIGTIIGMPTPDCDRLHIFSSGVGYNNLSEWNVARRIWCVRGPLTARLLATGADSVLTDGAILTPWVVAADAAPPTTAAIGVMPHWESLHYPGWSEACDLAGFQLISPIGEPENVVRVPAANTPADHRVPARCDHRRQLRHSMDPHADQSEFLGVQVDGLVLVDARLPRSSYGATAVTGITIEVRPVASGGVGRSHHLLS